MTGKNSCRQPARLIVVDQLSADDSFSVTLWQGQEIFGRDSVSLDDPPGSKPLIVNFWSTEGGVSEAELPEIQRFYNDNNSQVNVLLVHNGSSKEGAARLQELGITLPAGHTDYPYALDEFEITGFPSTVFLTAAGSIHDKWHGALNHETLVSKTEELLALADAPPSAQTTTTPTLATPSGQGICSRSPAVQEAILWTLRTSACRLVTTEELYRITQFYNLRGNVREAKFETLQPGGLNGLVNLEHLTITGDLPLPAGTFAGAAIGQLSIKGIHLSPEAFQGIVSLTKLRVESRTTQEIPTLTDPIFTQLKELHLYFVGSSFSSPPSGHELNALKALTHFSLSGSIGPAQGNVPGSQGYNKNPEFTLPQTLFTENTSLESISIKYNTSGFQLTIPHTLLEHLHHLKRVTIADEPTIANRPTNGPPLALSANSPLGEYLTLPDPLPTGWTFSARFYHVDEWQRWTGTEDGARLKFGAENTN